MSRYDDGFNQEQPFLETHYSGRENIQSALVNSVQFLVATNFWALIEEHSEDLNSFKDYGYTQAQQEIISKTLNGNRPAKFLTRQPDLRETIFPLTYLNPQAKIVTHQYPIKGIDFTTSPTINLDWDVRRRSYNVTSIALPLIHSLTAPFTITAWGNCEPPLQGELMETANQMIYEYQPKQYHIFYLSTIALALNEESQQKLSSVIKKHSNQVTKSLASSNYLKNGRVKNSYNVGGADKQAGGYNLDEHGDDGRGW